MANKMICSGYMLFLLPMLVGCSASSPTEDAAKKVVQEDISKENQERLIIVSFHKTDGQSSVVNGVPIYKMKFEGEVEVTVDCVGTLQSLRTTAEPMDTFITTPEGKKVIVQRDTRDRLKKGARQKFSGEIWFEKTENGWKTTYFGKGWL